MMGCEREAMRAVMETGFVVQDLLLYLDTHPTCSDGLARYQQAKEDYIAAVKAYTAQYGPLTAYHADACNSWSWVRSPWPWELED